MWTRRNFIARILASLAALPLVGKLAQAERKTVWTGVLDDSVQLEPVCVSSQWDDSPAPQGSMTVSRNFDDGLVTVRQERTSQGQLVWVVEPARFLCDGG